MLETTLQTIPTTVALFLRSDTDRPAASKASPAVFPFDGRGENRSRQVAGLTAIQAAEVREAMFICTLERIAQAFASQPDVDLALCVDIDAFQQAGEGRDDIHSTADEKGRYTIGVAPPRPLGFLPPQAEGWDVFPQAPGPMGERLALAWQIMGCGRVVFLGIDAPDVPLTALQSIIPHLEQADFVIGKSRTDHMNAGNADGDSDSGAGYWALAGNRYRPNLLEGIDWRAGNVYHQAMRAAQRANLTHAQLPEWPGCDPVRGLDDLLERLRPATDPPLVRLRQRLLAVVGEP